MREGRKIKVESGELEERYFETSKVIRRSLLAVFISVGSILALFLWMRFKGERVVLELRAPLYLLPATGFVVLAWLTDALRLSLTTGVWKKRISLRNALTVVLATHFLAGITPSNTGGGAVEIYLLHRLGMSWGEASSLSLSCGLLYQAGFLALFLLAPASVSFSLFSKTILVIFLAYGVALTSFFILSQNQKMLPGIIEKVVKLPKKYFPRYATYEEKTVVSAAQSFLQELRSGFQLLFLKKPHYSVLNIAFYALHFFLLFSTTTFIIRSLGLALPLFEVVKLQIPAFFLFRLTPTPGGSGGIELALASTFTPFLGENYAGAMVFLWRILTYYLTLWVGGITFLRAIRKI